jgi:hypothetical protein
MHVAAPAGVSARRVTAFADGRAVASSVEPDGLVTFLLPTSAGAPADWALVAPGATVPAVAVACASRRHFYIRLVAPRGQRLRRATVFVNGRRVRVITGRRLRAPVDLRGLARGTFRVRIDAVTVRGRHTRRVRTYHTCIPRRTPSRRGHRRHRARS